MLLIPAYAKQEYRRPCKPGRAVWRPDNSSKKGMEGKMMMQNNYIEIRPTQDLAYRKCFSSLGNEDILAGLIEDFFGFRPKDVTIVSPYNISEYWEIYKRISECEGTEEAFEERNRLIHTLTDIEADLVVGDYTSEMQAYKSDFFEVRSIYYPFSRFSAGFNRAGNRYGDLRPMYALNILTKPFFKHDAAVKSFELFDPFLGIPMDKEWLRIVYFELTKDGFRNDNQALWKKFFLGEQIPDWAPDYIKKAKQVIDISNFGKEERAMVTALELAKADSEAYLNTAKTEGRAEGRAEVAKKLKEEGAEKALILKVTGISEEEYDAL